MYHTSVHVPYVQVLFWFSNVILDLTIIVFSESCSTRGQAELFHPYIWRTELFNRRNVWWIAWFWNDLHFNRKSINPLSNSAEEKILSVKCMGENDTVRPLVWFLNLNSGAWDTPRLFFPQTQVNYVVIQTKKIQTTIVKD